MASARGGPRRAALVALALLLGSAAGVGLAQYEGELDVVAVIAPVTVRTGSGRIVTGLPASKFQLLVDGIPVLIQDVAPEVDLPLSLGFILDTSGSMAGRKIESCQRLVHAFLQERRPEDQIALWTFGDDRVMERFPFGMGWYLLPRVLESIRPWSTTALYDMIQRVPHVMERASHPRRAAILLTDGVDNASAIDHRQAQAIAEGLRTPIYVLGVEPPPIREDGQLSYEEVLRLIADSSGGHYERIPTTADMPEAARALLEELSSRYIVSFETSGLGTRRWRTIEVRVHGYVATTRKGYVGTLP
jgi:Ca-activated chloride channel family protein